LHLLKPVRSSENPKLLWPSFSYSGYDFVLYELLPDKSVYM